MEPGLGTEQISCVICRGKVVVGGLGALCLSCNVLHDYMFQLPSEQMALALASFSLDPPQLSSLNRQPVSDNTLSSTPESISNMDSSLGMTGLPSISVQSIALPSYDPSLRSHIPSVCSRLPSTSVQSTLTALPSTSTSPYSRPNGRPNANSVNRLRKSKVLEYFHEFRNTVKSTSKNKSTLTYQDIHPLNAKLHACIICAESRHYRLVQKNKLSNHFSVHHSEVSHIILNSSDPPSFPANCKEDYFDALEFAKKYQLAPPELLTANLADVTDTSRTLVPPSVTTIQPTYFIPSVLPQANTFETIMADNRTPVPPSVTTIDPAYVIPSVLPQANTLKTITADNVICSHCKDILSPTHLLRLCVYQKPVEFEICPNRTVLDLKALILRDMGVDHEAETKWEILVKEKGWRDLEEFKSLTLNAASVRSGNIVHVFSRMLGATDFYRNNDKDSSDDQIVFPSIPVITDIDDATHEVNSGLPDMSVPSISKTNTYLTVSDSKPMNVFDATKTLVAVLLTSPDDIDQQTVSKPNTWNSAVLNCKRMDVFDTTKFMYEVLGRLAPFSRMTKNLQRVIGSVKDDECQSRDDATENVSDDCWNLFQQCWVQDTTARPLFRVRLSV